jgi:hypothetical protein
MFGQQYAGAGPGSDTLAWCKKNRVACALVVVCVMLFILFVFAAADVGVFGDSKAKDTVESLMSRNRLGDWQGASSMGVSTTTTHGASADNPTTRHTQKIAAEQAMVGATGYRLTPDTMAGDRARRTPRSVKSQQVRANLVGGRGAPSYQLSATPLLGEAQRLQAKALAAQTGGVGGLVYTDYTGDDESMNVGGGGMENMSGSVDLLGELGLSPY